LVLLTWPQKCAIQCKIILVVYPFHDCIIATFITKTWLTALMWDTNSVLCCWHCCHVFVFRNIYMWLALTLALASWFWPWPWPWPRGSGLKLDLSLVVLALTLTSASAFSPRLTSLVIDNVNYASPRSVTNTWINCN